MTFEESGTHFEAERLSTQACLALLVPETGNFSKTSFLRAKLELSSDKVELADEPELQSLSPKLWTRLGRCFNNLSHMSVLITL